MVLVKDLELSERILWEDIYSDEPEMETPLHLEQMLLLLTLLRWWWREGGPAPRQNYFAAGNLSIYYSPEQLRNRDFRGPDFFVVLNVAQRTRKSWVVWQEGGKYPNVIVEILSDTTADKDRTTKKELYQKTFRTPEYFWFDPESLEFEGFHLVNDVYHPIVRTAQGWKWSQQLQLYLGIYDQQLRFFTPEGELILTPQEMADQETQRANAEAQRAEAEAQRAEVESQRAETERQRAEVESQRAEAEAQRAEVESQRAETERQRADQIQLQLEQAQRERDELLQQLQTFRISLSAQPIHPEQNLPNS
jgi:Uma2 family endonuclease